MIKSAYDRLFVQRYRCAKCRKCGREVTAELFARLKIAPTCNCGESYENFAWIPHSADGFEAALENGSLKYYPIPNKAP